MPKYDNLSFLKHKETSKLHLFRSRFENNNCYSDKESICDENVEFTESEDININCKSEETILNLAVKLHLKGDQVCGICMSRIFARGWQY